MLLTGRDKILAFGGSGSLVLLAGSCGSGFRGQGSGFRVQGPGFRVRDSGFRVQCSGFWVQGSGCRVQGCRTVISKVLVSGRCGEKDTPLSALSVFFTSATILDVAGSCGPCGNPQNERRGRGVRRTQHLRSRTGAWPEGGSWPGPGAGCELPPAVC